MCQKYQIRQYEYPNVVILREFFPSDAADIDQYASVTNSVIDCL